MTASDEGTPTYYRTITGAKIDPWKRISALQEELAAKERERAECANREADAVKEAMRLGRELAQARGEALRECAINYVAADKSVFEKWLDKEIRALKPSPASGEPKG